MSIIRAGTLLIVYLFCVLTVWIFLGGVVDDLITDFEDINSTASDSHIEYHAVTVRASLDISFALSGLVPIAWFIFWIFYKEPDRRYYQ